MSRIDIAQILAGLGTPQPLPQAPADPSMVLASLPPDVAQAAMAQQPQNPYLPNQPLEAAAQTQGQTPMHPLVNAIAQRLGLTNLLRNRANTQMVAGPGSID